MSFAVVYAPHPPQVALEIRLEDLARRDARFFHLRTLRARGVLDLALQDSADLQQAHLTVREGRVEWRGTPGALDEHGPRGTGSPFHGWSELALEYTLGLDLGPVQVRAVDEAALGAELATWHAGVVYIFSQPAGVAPLGISRRLNLASFFDRLEAEFLLRPGLDAALVRAHRLTDDGRHQVLRTEVRPVPPAARALHGREEDAR